MDRPVCLCVVNKGVGLCNEAVPVRVRPKGGLESKDSSPLIRLPMKVCTLNNIGGALGLPACLANSLKVIIDELK